MKQITISDQLDLEKRMIDLGITRFVDGVKRAEAKGRGSETSYARKLMKELILPLAEAIEEFTSIKGAGSNGKYRKLIRMVKPEQAAYFVLKATFKYFTKNENIQSLCAEIGRYIEDEAKFSLFHKQHGEYYSTIIEDFKHKGTKNYRHMHRVLTFKANEKSLKWNDWTNTERITVGLCMIGILLDSTDLIEKRIEYTRFNKKKTVIVPTLAAQEWVKTYNEKVSLLNPDTFPCIIEPDPWTEINQGGFYTPQLRSTIKLIKTRAKRNKKLKTADLSNVMKAVNILQATPWSVNKQVFEVLRQVWDKSLGIGMPSSSPMTIPPCPVPEGLKKNKMSKKQLEAFNVWKKEAAIIYTMEKQRVSKCFQVIRTLRMATEFQSYDQFWYVYYCDFRGRIYCSTTSFSPQGPDFAKGLLRFSQGKRVGFQGEYWLKVHGANCFGYDKVSYDERVQWVDANKKNWLAVAQDPVSTREYWANADKPWQFLAWCFEYQGLIRDKEDFVSYLPISLDGSCNGLQNFSAMLRDEVGGKATNLVSMDKPSDIYATVSDVCTSKLRCDKSDLAKSWLKLADEFYEGVLPRNLSKKSVMTLPYGSTKHSCTDNVFEFLMEYHPEYFPIHLRFKLCAYLTPILWDSINEVVVAARSAMDWLQKCSGILAKENMPCNWVTPIGLPVLQGTEKIRIKHIDTILSGNIRICTNSGELTDQLDIKKQKQGISPNFVHSMDACHLMKTILLSNANGISNFSCVHDDYATHACHTEELQRYLRQAFIDMYVNHDPLKEFKESNELDTGIKLPDLPSTGSLDIQDVLKSKYFFG